MNSSRMIENRVFVVSIALVLRLFHPSSASQGEEPSVKVFKSSIIHPRNLRIKLDVKCPVYFAGMEYSSSRSTGLQCLFRTRTTGLPPS